MKSVYHFVHCVLSEKYARLRAFLFAFVFDSMCFCLYVFLDIRLCRMSVNAKQGITAYFIVFVKRHFVFILIINEHLIKCLQHIQAHPNEYMILLNHVYSHSKFSNSVCIF